MRKEIRSPGSRERMHERETYYLVQILNINYWNDSNIDNIFIRLCWRYYLHNLLLLAVKIPIWAPLFCPTISLYAAKIIFNSSRVPHIMPFTPQSPIWKIWVVKISRYNHIHLYQPVWVTLTLLNSVKRLPDKLTLMLKVISRQFRNIKIKS